MKQNPSRRTVLTGSVGGGIGMLAGCIGDIGGNEPEAPDGGDGDQSFVIGLHSDPADDQWAVYENVVPYFTQVFEPLVAPGDNLEPVPLLASDWEVLYETTWAFDLRDGVMFHDGTELTADHVVESFDAAFDHWEWLPGWIGVERDGVIATDGSTVEFETTEPFPTFPGTISHHYFGIEHVDADEPPVGTGPFQVEEVDPGKVQLVPNEDYRDGSPTPASLTFQHVADPTTRVLSLEDGEIDVAHDVPKEQANSVEGRSETEIESVLRNHAGLAAVNLYKEPTTDERLRQALNWAVDQEQLVETVLDGFGEPARGPFSKQIPWAIHDELPTYGPDRDRARELVAESSYDGETLSILVDSDDADDRTTAEVLQQWYDEIGVDVEIMQVDPAAWYDTFTDGEAHLTLVGFGSNSASADYLVRAMFHSMGSDNRQLYQADGTGVYNPGEEVDELIESGYRAESVGEKREYYGEVQQLVVETGAIVPLYYDEYVLGHRSEVEGIETHTIDKFIDWTDMTR